MARRPHKQVHAVCPYGATTWARCDAALNDAYTDWQAMQQVILAYRIAAEGRRMNEDNFLAQLVDYIGGHAAELLDKKGNPAVGPWPMRVRAAIQRVIEGDLPAYNLYQPVDPAN